MNYYIFLVLDLVKTDSREDLTLGWSLWNLYWGSCRRCEQGCFSWVWIWGSKQDMRTVSTQPTCSATSLLNRDCKFMNPDTLLENHIECMAETPTKLLPGAFSWVTPHWHLSRRFCPGLSTPSCQSTSMQFSSYKWKATITNDSSTRFTHDFPFYRFSHPHSITVQNQVAKS